MTTVDMSLRYLLLNQLRFLRDSGYEVAGISAPGPDVEALEGAGIRHHAVPLTRRLSPLQDLRALFALYRVIRRERFTIVHTHTPKAGLLGQIAAGMARVPIVINTVHGYYFHDNMRWSARRFFVALERLAAWFSDFVLSQNREDVETAVAEKICRPSKISFLGNGIDLTRFAPQRVSAADRERLRRELGIPSGAPVVGFVGRLVEEKGVLVLLDAARQVLRTLPDVRFLFVGPRDEAKSDAVGDLELEGQGLAEACIFAGLRKDMPELYSVMDLFCLPSFREGMPRSPMEASAMGVPAIVSDIRGCREVVEQERNGLLVPSGDPEALAEALLRVLRDPELAARMGRAGRALAAERFDELRVFERVAATYRMQLDKVGILPPRREGRTTCMAGEDRALQNASST